jgi:MFS family permease
MSFVLFALMTGISLLFYAPVNILAKKFGKKKIVQWAFMAFAGVFTLTTFCGMWGIGGMAWGVIVSALAAIPMAALGILPQAVVADIAEADRITTGENRQGMFYAARTFAFKLGQSVAMLIFTSLAKVGSQRLRLPAQRHRGGGAVPGGRTGVLRLQRLSVLDGQPGIHPAGENAGASRRAALADREIRSGSQRRLFLHRLSQPPRTAPRV